MASGLGPVGPGPPGLPEKTGLIRSHIMKKKGRVNHGPAFFVKKPRCYVYLVYLLTLLPDSLVVDNQIISVIFEGPVITILSGK